MIQELSKRIENPQALRVLGINGLEMEPYVTESVLQTNKDLHQAALKLLKTWEKGLPNRKMAYSKLCQALESVNMAFYVNEILKKD